MQNNQVPSSTVGIGASGLGTQLQQLLMADDIEPGSQPSYQLAKTIYRYHPLGGKIADAPIKLAQTKSRQHQVESAPQEVTDAFDEAWQAIRSEQNIRATATLKRVYGVSAALIIFKSEQDAPEKWKQPLDPARLSTEEFDFNILDPLNTSGSLVLNQDPNSITFQKPGTFVTAGGQPHHGSRACIQFNEQPVYIEYQSAAFGFSGVSVYQRALYPLKSYVQTMITNDMVTRKAGILVAFIKAAGSVVSGLMQALTGIKRSLLRMASTDNVLSVDVDEKIESLNMENIDKAMITARTNIIDDIAAGVPMPALMIKSEALAQGFADGSEDAKVIVRYADEVRAELQSLYDFFTMVAQRKAWTPAFFQRMQALYPEEYPADMKYEQAFFAWRKGFKAEWPNLLTEPDSEKAKQDKVKLEGLISVYIELAKNLDPENKGKLTSWLMDNANQYRHLFPVSLDLEVDTLVDWYHEQQEKAEAAAQAAPQGGEVDTEPGGGDKPRLSLAGGRS